MTTVVLSKQIQAHGREYKTIELRDPNGVDIQACGGNPMAFAQGTDGVTMAVINAHTIAAYVARLGEIPPSSVGQLCAVDWMKCQKAVTDFFNEPEPEETSSTDISISSGSGNGSLVPSSH